MTETTERKTLLGRDVSPSESVEKIVDNRLQTSGGTFRKAIRAVLFSDIVGSTAFFEKFGDERGMSMVEQHNSLLFPCVTSNKGSIVKTIGDAIMASFEHADEAVACAVAMQEALKSFNEGKQEIDNIHVRIGINFGEVILQGGDLFGDVVNAAARVEALASGDMILISAQLRDALNKVSFKGDIFDYDAVYVKGKSHPIEVFQVRWDPDAPISDDESRAVTKPGDLLGGRFEILQLLGEGGMGQVFKARDKALDELVALKFIRLGLANDSDSLEMFKREVKLARSITHPNICRIHEFLQMEGKTFLSMELVEGVSLSDWMVHNAPAKFEQASPIIEGIAHGMEAAHGRGVTHRDLKPSNVMIERETGRVVIMDFGIASLVGRRSEQNGFVAGTPEYMSPEQAQGLDVGPAGDIYSLGIIVYEILCGHCPFEDDSPEKVAQMQVDALPRPLSELVTGLPASVNKTIMKALRKNPMRRFHSALYFASALGLHSEINSKRSRRMLPYVAAIVFLFAALWLAFIIFHEGPPGGVRKIKPVAASGHVEQSPRWSWNGKILAFFKDGRLYESSVDNSSSQLVSSIEVPSDFELSGMSWLGNDGLLVTSATADKPSVFRVNGDGASSEIPLNPIGPVDACCHGKKIVFVRRSADHNTELVKSSLDGDQEITLLASDPKVSYERPRWSPDGKAVVLVVRYLGFLRTRDIGIVTDAGSLRMLTTDGLTDRVENTDPTWTRDGNWIVYSSRRNGSMSLWCVAAKGGKSYPLTQATTQEQRSPDVSADGLVAFQTSSKRLNISSLSIKGKAHEKISDDQFSDRFPSYSPDGNRIAYRSMRDSDHPEKRQLVILSLNGGPEHIVDLPEGVRDFAWCGADAIAYAQTLGKSRNLGIMSLSTEKHRTLVRGFDRLWSPTADRECTKVFFSGRQKKDRTRDLWVVDVENSELRELEGGDGVFMYPSLSPDSKLLAFRWAPSLKAMGMSELRLMVLKNGKVKKVSSHVSFRHSMRRIKWSANSKRLYYMEAAAHEGVLWSIGKFGTHRKKLLSIGDINSFDFDIDTNDEMVIYPSVEYNGDVFTLSGVQW